MNTLFSMLAVFLLEQFAPLSFARFVDQPIAWWQKILEAKLNAGKYWHGILAWMISVLPLVFISMAVYYLLGQINPVFAWLCNAFLLYLTMGFRQFSSYFTAIHHALIEEDLEQASSILSSWRGYDESNLNRTETARLAIEEALAASHRHVFGVLFWFIILPGPLGAVLYRLAAQISQYWRQHESHDNLQYAKFSQQVFSIIDWLPVRSTAILFAIAGNFEDAISCWREQANRWKDKEIGIVLASGAGALGVELGVSSTRRYALDDSELDIGSSLGVGEPASTNAMERAIALGLRSALICLILSLFLALAGEFS